MSKRLALILRGISFDENFKHVCMPRNNIVNYKYTIDNFNKYIIDPLSKIFDVDIFFITYNTEKTADIINDYKPKDYILIEDTDEWYSNNSIVKYSASTLSQYFSSTQKAILKKVESYEKKNNFSYNQILITRFDLFFIKDITSYILDFDKFNLVCYSEGYWHHSTYDNFYLFNRKYLNSYYESLDEIFSNGLSSHYLYNMLYIKIGKENISFLFKGGIINEEHKKIINKFYIINPIHIKDGMKQFGNGHELVEKNKPSWLFDKNFTPTDYHSHSENIERYFNILKNNFAEYCNRINFKV
tara:strand:- start:230 stop:1129 length:900 start_codon:yes stop_codon:yes gene_type:complete